MTSSGKIGPSESIICFISVSPYFRLFCNIEAGIEIQLIIRLFTDNRIEPINICFLVIFRDKIVSDILKNSSCVKIIEYRYQFLQEIGII